MTKEAAINMSYLAAAELLKEAAEEEGVDLDALVENGELDEADHAEMLDDTVLDLAEAGELDEIFAQVPDEEFEDEGEGEGENDVEAEGFIGKTAALLDKAAAAKLPTNPLKRMVLGLKNTLKSTSERGAKLRNKINGPKMAREAEDAAHAKAQAAKYKPTKESRAAARELRDHDIMAKRVEAVHRVGTSPTLAHVARHAGKYGAGAGAGALGLGGLGYAIGKRKRG